jgi:hypothetical protein
VDFTDTITTSGVYTLTLGDGATTQNFDVQYNVIGLATNTIKKDGAAQANLTDIEITIMTGLFGTRTFVDQFSGVTTDANGNTGGTIVSNGEPGDGVYVAQGSFDAGIGIVYGTTLELL